VVVKAPTKAELGLAVREVRKKRGLSQEALAHASGLHPTYISGIERGLRNPTWSSIARLCQALDVRVSELAELSERRTSEAPR
jgi:XRE family transcriptional regulator, regulator of sulfur utilization